jgi:hypothetical protein
LPAPDRRNLRNCNLNGALPAETSAFEDVTYLDLAYNTNLDGVLPPMYFGAMLTCFLFAGSGSYYGPFKCPWPAGVAGKCNYSYRNALGLIMSRTVTSSICQDVATTCAAGEFAEGGGATCAPCLAGTWSGAAGKRAACTPCPQGKFETLANQIACSGTCAAGEGNFYNNYDAPNPSCPKCPSGHFNENAGTGICTSCPPGKYASSTGSLSCASCTAGYYASAGGSASCKICPAGKYGGGGASNCVQQPSDCLTTNPGFVPGAGDTSKCNIATICPKGTFAPTCATCPAGKYQDKQGQTSCKACVAGQYGPGGAVPCADCSKGQYQGGGAQTSCKSCTGGRYQPMQGQVSCQACGSAAVYCPANSTKQVNVPRDFLSTPQAAPEAERSGFERCPPTGILCRGGVGIMLDGYWLPPGTAGKITSTTVIYKCPVASACTASDNATSVVCEAGHMGLLCGECKSGYGMAPSGACADCPSHSTAVLVTFIAAFMGCAVAAALTRKTLPTVQSKKPASSHGWVRRTHKALCPCAKSSGAAQDTSTTTGVTVGAARDTGEPSASKAPAVGSAIVVVRTLVSYMQLTSLLQSFKLDWGSSLRSFFGMQQALSGATPPLLRCAGMSFAAESKLALALPALIIGGPALLIALWHVWHLHIKKKLLLGGDEPGQVLTLWGVPPWQVLPNAVLTLSTLFWPTLIGALMRIVDCSVVVGDVSYVASALPMRCGSGEHEALAGVAKFYLVTLVPAFPLGVFVLLHRNRDNLDDEAFSQRFSFLYQGYKRCDPTSGAKYGLAWWESVVMARKFFLVAVTVWFARNPNYQIYAGIWVLLIAMLMQVLCQPYEDELTGRLESLSLCAIACSLLLGLGIALGGLSPAAVGVMRTLTALINLGMICYFALCLFTVLGMRDIKKTVSGMCGIKKSFKSRKLTEIEMVDVRQPSVATNPLSSGESEQQHTDSNPAYGDDVEGRL